MRISVPEQVVHRAFGEQTVLLNLGTGQYHGLNATGQRIFELLVERGSTDGVAAQIAQEYDIDEELAAADLGTLCSALTERGLLETDADASA
jgi:hypothetical protein